MTSQLKDLTVRGARRTRRNAALLIAMTALGVTAACNADTLLTETPKSIIVPDNLYVDAAGFEAGLNALYAQVRRERAGQDGGQTNDLYASGTSIGVDNGFGNQVSPTENLLQLFGTYNTPLTSFHNTTWVLMYATINQANTIINRADNPAVSWTPQDKARVVGEARLIRAWAYRYLTYYFGDVPVTLVESSGENIRTDFERIPRDSVRRIIVNDLLFAEANLPLTSTNNGKLTKGVAEHYLAEMYLALGDAAQAEAKATAVIGSGVYKLITARYGVAANQPGVAFMDQFLDGNANRSQGNTEALWVLQYAENVPGGGVSIMRRSWVSRYETNPGMKLAPEDGGRGIGRNSITKWALNLYEPSDTRGGPFAIRKFYLYNNPVGLPAGKKLGDTLFTVAVK
ncbi:MAG: RagB/SusD family nutrient uptake outer membrane protein, partial [Gemmatimonadota bacterium]|nr:RagB/SusD family nutrient uptake outer membrane protein [Gemmatimonadota bacterium]